MAVIQLYGKVDNNDVIFSKTEQGLWETIVPFDEDGYYVVDLIAVDEAGNKGYFAKVLFIVDTSNLKYKVKIKVLKLYNSSDFYKLNKGKNNNFTMKKNELNAFDLRNTTLKYVLGVRGCTNVL